MCGRERSVAASVMSLLEWCVEWCVAGAGRVLCVRMMLCVCGMLVVWCRCWGGLVWVGSWACGPWRCGHVGGGGRRGRVLCVGI